MSAHIKTPVAAPTVTPEPTPPGSAHSCQTFGALGYCEHTRGSFQTPESVHRAILHDPFAHAVATVVRQDLYAEIAALRASLRESEAREQALRAQRDGLGEIIWWALGERDEFPEPPPAPAPGKPIRRYWWRSELRSRFEMWTAKHVNELTEEGFRASASPAKEATDG